jgi:integrase
MKRRSDGRYQKRITLPNGRSKTLYSTAANERLAQKDFTEQIMKLEHKSQISLQFAAVAEAWREEAFPKLTNNSLKLYKVGFREALEYFGSKPIADIKPIEVQRYVDYLQMRGYAPKTIRGRLLVVSLVFKFGALTGYIEVDPTSRIKLPTAVAKVKREAATTVDEQRIIAAKDLPLGALALFFLMTGCRRGEAMALTPQDINLNTKTVSVTKTVEWIGNVAQIKPTPKTEAGIRDIPLSDSLIKIIKPLMSQKYLFPGYDGTVMKNAAFTRAWTRYRKESGVDCTPHQLRHSYATMLFDAGIDVKTAQRWLGHKDIKTTLDVYTHISDSRIEKSTEKISAFLESKFVSENSSK